MRTCVRAKDGDVVRVTPKSWERGKAEDFEAVALGYHNYTVLESMTETARKGGNVLDTAYLIGEPFASSRRVGL